MRFLVYDVETAQGKNIGSICSVGWILIENDTVVNSGYSLINPLCRFSNINTEIHGITSKDVKDAPCFAEYWESTLRELMAKSIVLAHSASFDLAATEQALFNAGIPDPGIWYLDTLPLIKGFLKLKSYKLESLVKIIKYQYEAHNALEDVKALTQVLFFLRDYVGAEDLGTLIIRSPARCENTDSNHFIPKEVCSEDEAPSPRIKKFQIKSRCTEDVEAKSDRFAGLAFCITGDLEGFDRADLEKMILENAGRIVSGVSGKTDFLLVCDRADQPESEWTSKRRKAQELMEAGGKVKIISPDTFFRMIEG